MSNRDFSEATDFEWALEILASVPLAPFYQAEALRERLCQLLTTVVDAADLGLKRRPAIQIASNCPTVRIGDETIEFNQVDMRWGYRVSHSRSEPEPFVAKPEGADLLDWAVEITRGAVARALAGL